MSLRYFLSFVGLMSLLSEPGYSQEVFAPDPVKKKVTATRIEGSLVIDGKLDEPEWLSAGLVPDLVQTDPVQGGVAARRTVVRLLYNKNYLYVSAVCYDSIGKDRYRVLNFKRDYVASSSDFFAVAIDGYNDERNAVMFGMNPYGVQRDLLSFDDNYYDPDWDGLWMVRTQRTDTAWIAEAAIPWKTLRYKRLPDSLQTWGISFGRIARTINEFSNWPAVPRAFGGLRMAYAGKLVNIQAPRPSTNLRVQPYLLYSRDEQGNGSKPSYADTRIKPGGDIKWAINPNALLDMSFNTDFAQADVDRLVNNISRFSIFYPERRSFFLENAGLFAVGLDPLSTGLSDYSTRIQPFFSRAIGLDANGNPLSIDAGARFVYRSERRNAGALLVRQEGNAHTGPADLLVGRYSENFGQQNRIGVLVSHKKMEQGGSMPDNFTGSVDGFFRFGQGLSWSWMASSTANGRGKYGLAGTSQLYYNSNRLSVWWTQSVVSKDYDPQMGFVARSRTIVTDPGMSYQLRGGRLPGFIRSYTPGFSLTMYHDVGTGHLTDRYVSINPVNLQFQHGGVFSWQVVFTGQSVDSGFAPLGVSIEAGRYSYTRHKLLLSSDPSRKIAISLGGDLGRYYNGTYHAVTAALSLAPSPYFFLTPSIEAGRLEHVGKTGGHRDVQLYMIEARVAASPRIQLTGLFQRSTAASSTNWNARFSWEFRPLSYFYIVYNSSRGDGMGTLREQQAIAKITYLYQF